MTHRLYRSHELGGAGYNGSAVDGPYGNPAVSDSRIGYHHRISDEFRFQGCALGAGGGYCASKWKGGISGCGPGIGACFVSGFGCSTDGGCGGGCGGDCGSCAG